MGLKTKPLNQGSEASLKAKLKKAEEEKGIKDILIETLKDQLAEANLDISAKENLISFYRRRALDSVRAYENLRRRR